MLSFIYIYRLPPAHKSEHFKNIKDCTTFWKYRNFWFCEPEAIDCREAGKGPQTDRPPLSHRKFEETLQKWKDILWKQKDLKKHKDERHRRQWRKPDWDVWQAIRAVDTSKTKLKWVRGHADDRKKLQAYTAEETRNIEMDKEAEKHYIKFKLDHEKNARERSENNIVKKQKNIAQDIL